MDKQQYFFSVILPTFNRARLLPRAVDSLLAQTETSWELLIIDDGSTDDTIAIVGKYEGDHRIHFIRQSHRGLARTRSAGIAAATGKYVTFLDSDDAYAPEHLQLRREYLFAHPDVELLHGGVRVIGDPYVADKFNPSKKIHLDQCVIGGTFVIAKSLIEKIGWPIVDYGDDNAFYQRAVEAGANIAVIAAPTYIYYRGEEDSLCEIVAREGMAGVRKFQGNSSSK